MWSTISYRMVVFENPLWPLSCHSGLKRDGLPGSERFRSLCLWPGSAKMWTDSALSLDVRGGGDSGDPEISWEFVMDDYRIRRPDGNPLARGDDEGGLH